VADHGGVAADLGADVIELRAAVSGDREELGFGLDAVATPLVGSGSTAM
jgi:hypothetical protein